MYDEYIPTTSYRIAPKGFFTGRKGLLRFKLKIYLVTYDQNKMMRQYIAMLCFNKITRQPSKILILVIVDSMMSLNS